MRSGDGILAGVAMTPHRSLWCEVRGGTTIGLVVAGLASLVALGAQPSEGRRVEGAVTWTHGGDEAASAAFREFVERAPEVHAVLLTSAQEAEPLFGVGRASVPRDELFAVVHARAPALAAFEGAEVALEGSVRVDGPPRQMMSAEMEFALFAGEISQGPTRRLVWLVLERDASKGLGWGYMTSLRRRLERAWSASGTFYPPASLRAELLPM